jgi:hypothetical protein
VATRSPSLSGGVVGRTNSDIKRAHSGRACVAALGSPPTNVTPGMDDDQPGSHDHFRVIMSGDLAGDVEDSGSVADHARSASVARCTQEANFSESSRSAT